MNTSLLKTLNLIYDSLCHCDGQEKVIMVPLNLTKVVKTESRDNTGFGNG